MAYPPMSEKMAAPMTPTAAAVAALTGARAAASADLDDDGLPGRGLLGLGRRGGVPLNAIPDPRAAVGEPDVHDVCGRREFSGGSLALGALASGTGLRTAVLVAAGVGLLGALAPPRTS